LRGQIARCSAQFGFIGMGSRRVQTQHGEKERAAKRTL